MNLTTWLAESGERLWTVEAENDAATRIMARLRVELDDASVQMKHYVLAESLTPQSDLAQLYAEYGKELRAILTCADHHVLLAMFAQLKTLPQAFREPITGGLGLYMGKNALAAIIYSQIKLSQEKKES